MSLVMLRARHPIYLNAGPLGNMGYSTIVLVSFYLNLIKNVLKFFFFLTKCVEITIYEPDWKLQEAVNIKKKTILASSQDFRMD